MALLVKEVKPDLQVIGAEALCDVCCWVVGNQALLKRVLLESCSHIEDFAFYATSENHKDGLLQYYGGKLCALVDVSMEEKGRFGSSKGYEGEGDGKAIKGDYKGALGDFEDALAMDSGHSKTILRCTLQI